MKNTLEYYYNIKIDKLHNKDKIYSFYINNKEYILKEYFYQNNITNDLYTINNYLKRIINVDIIVPNKYNNIITYINNIPYILIQKQKETTLNIKEISNISNIKIPEIKSLERNNWEVLWSNKIDYYEMQVNENKKKYPLIKESFDYFIGLAENAISYLVNTKKETKPLIYDMKVISHNNLFDSIYDPLNIILDHKARDISEYIKLSFFNKNKNIYKELDIYFMNNIYSEYGIRILFSRLLYPSHYFNIYDNIILGNYNEKKLIDIIKNIKEYELYLYNMYLYLNKYYNIPSVEWLKKKDINPHSQP